MKKEKKQVNEVMDEEYVAFLLLESLYKSGKINKPTYENVLKEKRKYIEKKYKQKDVTVWARWDCPIYRKTGWLCRPTFQGMIGTGNEA